MSPKTDIAVGLTNYYLWGIGLNPNNPTNCQSVLIIRSWSIQRRLDYSLVVKSKKVMFGCLSNGSIHELNLTF